MTKELQGRILKNYNGYYYVKVEGQEGEYTCKLKGKLKQKRFSLVTGDFVLIEAGEGSEGMLSRILPRKNFLSRPAMANLDLFVVTMALVKPDFSFLLADKLLLLAALAKIPAILALNKMDVASPALVKELVEIYEKSGFEVYPISARTGDGIDALRYRLHAQVCAFGGPSGAGKSSTINAIDPSAVLQTGEVSKKIGRGKHTTRYAQLLPFNDGYIADTPGFGNLFLANLSLEQVIEGFAEFASFESKCYFHPCTHTHEPICGVKEAIKQGEIPISRYNSYVAIREEVKELQQGEGRI